MNGGTTALPRGIIKSTTDSFVVQEVDPDGNYVPLSDETLIRPWDGESKISVFELTKEGWSTEDATREVARQFRTDFNCVDTTGLKDKFALTSQRIGVRGNYNPFFRHRRIFLRHIGGAERLARHNGNHFSILVATDAQSIKLENASRFPNFFGPQRMGAEGSERIGRLLFEGKFTDAVEAVMMSPSRKRLEMAMDHERCSASEALFKRSFSFALKFELEKWQSVLWNALLTKLVTERGLDGVPRTLPMWSSRPDVVEMYRPFWCPPKLGATTWATALARPFLRPTIITPSNLSVSQKPAGWELTFDLPPGSYATVLLSQLFQWEEVHR
jgi:tRNA(Glu) U13 pseudouridine synthase TruD